jgi:hypothetical protein
LVIQYEFDIDPDVPDGRYEAMILFHTDDPIPIVTQYIVGEVTTGIEEEVGVIPNEYALMGPCPNPFNSATTIRWAIPEAGIVQIRLYDLNGRLVAPLAGGVCRVGWHRLTLDGSALPTGVYLLRMEAGSFTQTRRMVLLR